MGTSCEEHEVGKVGRGAGIGRSEEEGYHLFR